MHQCVRCGISYPDGSQELLKGCTCGSKFFFYIRAKEIEEAKSIAIDLTKEERVEIEKDIQAFVKDKIEDDKPVVLDIEAIRVLRPGQYEIDLTKLLKKQPLVYKLEDGKYIINLDYAFKNAGEEK
ncbi:MAG: Zn-ribbon containing protein [Candidatus Nanoarchaeia archaeon]